MMISALALLAAQPAAATPCELEGIAPLDLITLKVAILDQATTGTPRPPSSEVTMRAIEAKAATCQAGNDSAIDRAAVEVAASRLAADTVAAKLSADGIDMAKVAAEIEKTDKPILQALVARKMEAEGVETLRQRIMAAANEPGDDVRRLLAYYAVNAARVAIGIPAPIVVPPVATPKPKMPVER